MSAASGGNSEPKQGQRSQSARGFCPRSTMRVPQPDIIEHFGNADAVPQPPKRCLSRKAGIVRCCLICDVFLYPPTSHIFHIVRRAAADTGNRAMPQVMQEHQRRDAPGQRVCPEDDPDIMDKVQRYRNVSNAQCAPDRQHNGHGHNGAAQSAQDAGAAVAERKQK